MSEVGTNLTFVAPWEGEYPFTDRMKTASLHWVATKTNWAGSFNVDPALENSQGYLSALPTGSMEVWTSLALDPPSLPTTDNYVITWSGTGTFRFVGANVVSTGDHTMTVHFNGTSGTTNFDQLLLYLTSIDASDPVSDIHVVRADQVNLYNQGEIFNPAFVDKISELNTVRFMDWGATNTNQIVDWSDRASMDARTWFSEGRGAGVPIEVMVKLCNEAHVDMWFNVPTQATDDYVKHALQYIHDNLNSTLTAHVEYSNEVWNTGFEQSTYAAAQADELWGTDANGDGKIDASNPAEHVSNGWLQYYGYRSAQIASMAKDIWGDSAEARLETVISTQTWYAGLEKSIFTGAEKAGLGQASSLFDDYAITGYFGNALSQAAYNSTQAAQVVAWAKGGAAGLTAAFDQLENGGSVVNDSLKTLAGIYAYQANVAHFYNLNLTVYEGGAHLVVTGYDQSVQGVVQDFFQRLLDDPRMGDLYAENLANFNEVGGDLFNAYTDTGGLFGNLDSIYDDGSSRWEAYVDGMSSGVAGKNMNAPITGGDLAGTEGRDWIKGSAAVDVIDGKGGDDAIYGGASDDKLTGGGGNDFLDGGSGKDTLIGGDGDDTYVVDSTSDNLVEVDGAGYDTVYTSISRYTLANNLEALTYTGNSGFSGLGNDADNAIRGAGTGLMSLWGYGGNDLLVGGDGDDRLHGGDGTNTMQGGLGDDAYYSDSSSDVVVEAADGGYDEVKTYLTSYTLPANVEVLVYRGSDGFTGAGNELNNKIYGGDGRDYIVGNAGNDKLVSYDGDDTLDGAAGADRMYGGTGNDTYVVDNKSDKVVENVGEGYDKVIAYVSYNLAANVETLMLGGYDNLTGRGNDLDNQIVGNIADNKLSGMLGNDVVYAGAGDDRVYGDLGNDRLFGEQGVDYIWGEDGNDYIDGGSQSDRMAGGTGDDTYIVDVTGDRVTELAGEGYDTVNASVSYTLGANMEALNLGGSATVGRGNELDNSIFDNTAYSVGKVVSLYGMAGDDVLGGTKNAVNLDGGAGNDTLYGAGGNDVLTGGTGKDTIIGGAGADRFVFAAVDSGGANPLDRVLDFSHAQRDTIDLSGMEGSIAGGGAFSFIGGSAFSGVAGQLQVVQSGTNFYLSVDLDGDRHADFAVQVMTEGNVAPIAADFVL